MTEFTDGIATFVQENTALVVIITIFIIVFAYFKRKDMKRRKEEEEKKQLEKIKEETEIQMQSQPNFNTTYLQPEFTKMNHMPDNKLAYLKERRDKLRQELEESIVSFNQAKKQYKELEQIGKSLNHAIEVLKQEEARYTEQIKGLENARKNKT